MGGDMEMGQRQRTPPQFTIIHGVQENLNSTLTQKSIDEMKPYQAKRPNKNTRWISRTNSLAKSKLIVEPDATDEEVDR
jgi:hypothetical protein